jgi:non-ribosomal peptide synthetase component E (peptide arylation enzyme)
MMGDLPPPVRSAGSQRSRRVAYVVPAPGAEPDLPALRAWCTGQIADYKAPDRLELVAELPLTSMMKLDKCALARRADGSLPAG